MSAWDNSAGKPSIHLSCREKNEHKLTGELGTKASQLGEEKRKTRVWMSLVLTPYACAGRSPIHRDVLPCRKAPQVGGDDERPWNPKCSTDFSSQRHTEIAFAMTAWDNSATLSWNLEPNTRGENENNEMTEVAESEGNTWKQGNGIRQCPDLWLFQQERQFSFV